MWRTCPPGPVMVCTSMVPLAGESGLGDSAATCAQVLEQLAHRPRLAVAARAR